MLRVSEYALGEKQMIDARAQRDLFSNITYRLFVTVKIAMVPQQGTL